MLILVACMYALAAASFTIAKAALMYAQPLFFLAVRMIVAGAGILGYHRIAYGNFPRVKREDTLLFVLVAFVHIYLTFVLDLIALQFMGSAKAAFIYNLSPFIASFFSYFFFKERLTIKKICGLLIGLLGFVPELLINAPAEKISGMIAWFSGAELMMIGSVIASQLGWTLVRVLVKRSYSIPSINGYAMLFGGILSAITSGIFEYQPFYVKAWQPFVALTALIILVSNVLMYGIGTYLFKHYTVTFLSFAGFTTPLFAALFGKLFLGESVGVHFFFSLFVVSFGLWIFYGEEIRQGYIID